MLDGVFADEHGDYPAGTDLLNPDGSRHAPRSESGCCPAVVRLRQYPDADRPRSVLDTTTGLWAPGPTPGIEVQPLYAQAGHPERMRLERWTPGASRLRLGHPGSEEILVLDGDLGDEEGVYGPGGWLRYPAGDAGALRSDAGCRLYVRVGGLRWRG